MRSFHAIWRSQNIAQERLNDGIRAYYRLLEAIIVYEESRVGRCDFGHLFHSQIFNLAIMAMAFDLVLHEQGLKQLSFPWILGVCRVDAYDVVKVSPIIPTGAKRREDSRERMNID